MATKDDIIAELMAGETPYRVYKNKGYPRASVYRIYNELIQTGQLSGDTEVIHAEDLGIERQHGNSRREYPFMSDASTVQTQVKDEALGKTGAEVLDFTGPKGLPISAINRIRGILGITLRPKVLSCPTPELLYPAMVISITELGFPPMRPDDFIDTVLYQWLDACDIIPYAFMKKSELEEFANKYTTTTEDNIKDEKFRREHGLVTTDEINEAILKPLVEKEREATEEIEELLEEELPVEMESIIDKLKEVTEDIIEGEDISVSDDKGEESELLEPELEIESKPSGPTIGELLSRLHINNIRKEIENGSTGRTESNSP